MSVKKWWDSLEENERFLESVEVGVPDLPYYFLTEVEQKKLGEAQSYTNYGNQTGGNLTPAANGKSNVSNSYGDLDIEELSKGTEELEQFLDDVDKEGKEGGPGSGPQGGQGEKPTSDIKTEIGIAKSDVARLEKLRDNTGRSSSQRKKLDQKITSTRLSQSLLEDKLKNSSESIDDLINELEAMEGNVGSGKKGHQQWMRGAKETPEYNKCEDCGASTETRQGKCDMCGKFGESIEDIEKELLAELEGDVSPIPDAPKVEPITTPVQPIAQPMQTHEVEEENYEQYSNEEPVASESYQEPVNYNDPDYMQDFRKDEEADEVEEEQTQEELAMEQEQIKNKGDFSKTFEDDYEPPATRNTVKEIIEGITPEKAVGKEVAMEAKTTKFCDCGFYTNVQSELDNHVCS